MHDAVPKLVAIAVRMVITICITVFHVSFFIVLPFLLLLYTLLLYSLLLYSLEEP